MGAGLRTELVMVLAWLLFPMVPVVLEESYYQICVNLFGLTSLNAGPEPRDWGWGTWVMMLGPLMGYGFLAGATADVPDDTTGPKKGLRRVVARRAVWVAIAPWSGFLFLLAAFLGLGYLSSWLPQSQGDARLARLWRPGLTRSCRGSGRRSSPGSPRMAGSGRHGPRSNGPCALGLWRSAFYRGVVTALAFVGSLFGSFWAITSSWRSFFFDPRVMPMIAMALSLVVLSGCSSTITYGEIRRRELFHAMLLAWVFGLALIWWWSSRRRRQGPR